MRQLPADVLEFFKQQGQKGGETSAKNLTPQQRTERAKKAAAKSAEVRGKKKTPIPRTPKRPSRTGRLRDESFVADFTGRSIASLRRDRRARVGIPYIKIGRLVRYDMRDVEAYLQRCKQPTA